MATEPRTGGEAVGISECAIAQELLARYVRSLVGGDGRELVRVAHTIARDESAPARVRRDAARFLAEWGLTRPDLPRPRLDPASPVGGGDQ